MRLACFRKIVGIQFRQIQPRLHKAGSQLEATNEVLNYPGEAGFDPQFGARPLKRVLQRVILNELSRDILFGRVSKDAVVEDGAGKFERVERPAGQLLSGFEWESPAAATAAGAVA